jgi:hemin uptake protein HemP
MILLKGDNSSLIRHNTKSYDLIKGKQLIINKTQYKML